MPIRGHLRIALDAWEIYERLGSPEGELAIAQAITFLACAAKSNAVYRAHRRRCRTPATSVASTSRSGCATRRPG